MPAEQPIVQHVDGHPELPRALEPAVREQLVAGVREAGYQHVTIDLQGYRRGSLNDGLQLRPVP